MIGDRRPIAVVVTCEHGGNRVPARHAHWFASCASLLKTHRAYDVGALETARVLARRLDAALVASTVSRLVVDLNRSPGHPQWFGSALCNAPASVRDDIVEHIYRPYRERVQSMLQQLVEAGARVVHIGSHSFTPVLRGERRHAGVGLLFDPSRRFERAIAQAWQQALLDRSPRLVVRRNYPYRGVSDGFTTTLRRRFEDASYAGIELEVNQRLLRARETQARILRQALADALRAAIAALDTGSALSQREHVSRRIERVAGKRADDGTRGAIGEQ